MTAWNMNEDEIRILLGFEPQDLSLVKDILKGYSSLRGRDIKDRVAIFLDIRKSLHTLFRNSEVEKH
jgi:RES domain